MIGSARGRPIGALLRPDHSSSPWGFARQTPRLRVDPSSSLRLPLACKPTAPLQHCPGSSVKDGFSQRAPCAPGGPGLQRHRGPGSGAAAEGRAAAAGGAGRLRRRPGCSRVPAARRAEPAGGGRCTRVRHAVPPARVRGLDQGVHGAGGRGAAAGGSPRSGSRVPGGVRHARARGGLPGADPPPPAQHLAAAVLLQQCLHRGPAAQLVQPVQRRQRRQRLPRVAPGGQHGGSRVPGGRGRVIREASPCSWNYGVHTQLLVRHTHEDSSMRCRCLQSIPAPSLLSSFPPISLMLNLHLR